MPIAMKIVGVSALVATIMAARLDARSSGGVKRPQPHRRSGQIPISQDRRGVQDRVGRLNHLAAAKVDGDMPGGVDDVGHPLPSGDGPPLGRDLLALVRQADVDPGVGAITRPLQSEASRPDRVYTCGY